MTHADLFTIHTDGGARGNPGPAAFAFTLERPGHADVEEMGTLGHSTNNIAEYTALLKALERARELGGKNLLIHSDSELMVKQMRGEYKVKHEGLKPLYDQAKDLCRHFDHVTFRHIRREQNKRADELYNQALDAGKPAKTSSGSTKAPAEKLPRFTKPLPAGVREDVLECLRAAAAVWSIGNPNDPRAEEVWEQMWSILEEAGALKTVKR